MSERTHKAAIWYARHGWYVIPLHAPLFDNKHNCVGCTCEAWRRKHTPSYVCNTPGKHPVIKDWETNASNNIATINEWWKRWVWANVGIAAGKSGLLVFDRDSYKDTYEGDELLTPSDENTVTNLTGGGGTHLIYKMPDGATFTNAHSKLPTGIDIRGFGGQFVAPPSVHPSGQVYQWEAGFGPHEVSLLPVPENLRLILEEQAIMTLSPVSFVADVEPPPLEHIALRKEIVDLIRNEPVRGERSENDQRVIAALVHAGATDDEIRAVFSYYPIGVKGKFAEKAEYALQYLAHSIAHARGWVSARREEVIEKRTEKFFMLAVGKSGTHG